MDLKAELGGCGLNSDLTASAEHTIASNPLPSQQLLLRLLLLSKEGLSSLISRAELLKPPTTAHHRTPNAATIRALLLLC